MANFQICIMCQGTVNRLLIIESASICHFNYSNNVTIVNNFICIFSTVNSFIHCESEKKMVFLVLCMIFLLQKGPKTTWEFVKLTLHMKC